MKNSGPDHLTAIACGAFGVTLGNCILGIQLLLNPDIVTRETYFIGMLVCFNVAVVASLSITLSTKFRLCLSNTMLGMSAAMFMEWTSRQTTIDTYTVQFIEGIPTLVLAVILITIQRRRRRGNRTNLEQ